MAVSQGSGLTVPDACIHNVRKTSDVLDLMELGFKNRSVSATAMNERSSRSHRYSLLMILNQDEPFFYVFLILFLLFG